MWLALSVHAAPAGPASRWSQRRSTSTTARPRELSFMLCGHRYEAACRRARDAGALLLRPRQAPSVMVDDQRHGRVTVVLFGDVDEISPRHTRTCPSQTSLAVPGGDASRTLQTLEAVGGGRIARCHARRWGEVRHRAGRGISTSTARQTPSRAHASGCQSASRRSRGQRHDLKWHGNATETEGEPSVGTRLQWHDTALTMICCSQPLSRRHTAATHTAGPYSVPWYTMHCHAPGASH